MNTSKIFAIVFVSNPSVVGLIEADNDGIRFSPKGEKTYSSLTGLGREGKNWRLTFGLFGDFLVPVSQNGTLTKGLGRLMAAVEDKPKTKPAVMPVKVEPVSDHGRAATAAFNKSRLMGAKKVAEKKAIDNEIIAIGAQIIRERAAEAAAKAAA